MYRLPRRIAAGVVVLLCGATACFGEPAATQTATTARSPPQMKRPMLKLKPSPGRPDTIIISFTGKIRAPLADELAQAFEAHKATTRRIVLTLDSGGGSVKEGRKVIDVLSRIKATHQLDTFVKAGKRCGSMCVFLYAQGQKRYAAPASLWLFHEVSRSDKTTNQVYELDRTKWLSLIDGYLAPAGVSPAWIAGLKQRAVGADYWMTGDALMRENSGLIHKATSDEVKRTVVPKGPQPMPAAGGE